jgi:hypothetical protein
MSMRWPFVSALTPTSGRWKYRSSNLLTLTLQKPFATMRNVGGSPELILPQDIGADGWENMLVTYELPNLTGRKVYAFRVPADGCIAIVHKDSSWLMLYFPWNITEWAVPAAYAYPRHYGNVLVLRWAGLGEDVNKDKISKYVLSLNTSRRNRMPLVREDGDSVEVCYLFPNHSQPSCADNLPRRNDGDLRSLTPVNVGDLSDGSSLLDLQVSSYVDATVIQVRDLPLPVKQTDVIPLQGLASSPPELDIGFAYVHVNALRIRIDHSVTWVDVDKLFELLENNGKMNNIAIDRGGFRTSTRLSAWYELTGTLRSRIYRLSSPPASVIPGLGFSLYNPPEPDKEDNPDIGSAVPADIFALSAETEFSLARDASYSSYKWKHQLFTETDDGLTSIELESDHDNPGLRPTEADTTIIPQPNPTAASTTGSTYIRITGGGDAGGGVIDDPHSVLMQNIPPRQIKRVYLFLPDRFVRPHISWANLVTQMNLTDIVYHPIVNSAGGLVSASRIATALNTLAHATSDVRLHLCAFLKPDIGLLDRIDEHIQDIMGNLDGFFISSIIFDTETTWFNAARGISFQQLEEFAQHLKTKQGETGGFGPINEARPDLIVTEVGFVGPSASGAIHDRYMRLQNLIDVCDATMPQVYSGTRGRGNGIRRGWINFRSYSKRMIMALSAQHTANPGNQANIVHNRSDMQNDLGEVLSLEAPSIIEIAYWPTRLGSGITLDFRTEYIKDVCNWVRHGGTRP